jgi:fructose-1,6-bisphosphatase II
MASPNPVAWTQVARRLTESAARACATWVGEGNKDAADGAAVDAFQAGAVATELSGTVVIGEGEKDDAPLLAPGSQLGPEDKEPALDIAVDPLEGTALVANDAPGALSVLALAPADAMMPLGGAFYMEKLIGPPATHAALDLDASPEDVVEAVANALSVPPPEVRVAVQERPRHADLVQSLRAAGAQVRLFGEGDLSFALQALQHRSDGCLPPSELAPPQEKRPVDLLWGIGGAPEGMLAAAAQRALGGTLTVRLAPQSEAERTRLSDDPALPHVLDRTFSAGELVRTDTVAMTLTGITDGPLLTGVRASSGDEQVETLVIASGHAPRRVVTSRS